MTIKFNLQKEFEDIELEEEIERARRGEADANDLRIDDWKEEKAFGK